MLNNTLSSIDISDLSFSFDIDFYISTSLCIQVTIVIQNIGIYVFDQIKTVFDKKLARYSNLHEISVEEIKDVREEFLRMTKLASVSTLLNCIYVNIFFVSDFTDMYYGIKTCRRKRLIYLLFLYTGYIFNYIYTIYDSEYTRTYKKYIEQNESLYKNDMLHIYLIEKSKIYLTTFIVANIVHTLLVIITLEYLFLSS